MKRGLLRSDMGAFGALNCWMPGAIISPKKMKKYVKMVQYGYQNYLKMVCD
jgi:hypothetical protein